MTRKQLDKFWRDVVREARARVALHIMCQEVARSYNYDSRVAIKRAKAAGVYTEGRFKSDEFRAALENARDRYWFNLYGAGELERDDEYFEVVTNNGGFGVALTGDYWKRYRRILDWKLNHSDSELPPDWASLFGFNASGKREQRAPTRGGWRNFR